MGLSLRAGNRGFPPAAMSMTPGYFKRSQKGNKTKRTFYMYLFNSPSINNYIIHRQLRNLTEPSEGTASL